MKRVGKEEREQGSSKIKTIKVVNKEVYRRYNLKKEKTNLKAVQEKGRKNVLM